MRTSIAIATAVACVTFSLACDKDEPSTPDGTSDAGAPDLIVTPDVGPLDVGPPDAQDPPEVGPPDAQGPDGTPAEVDAGPPPECTTENAAINCKDFEACTEDRCVAGVCDNPPIAGCCSEDAQCDDSIDCTVDSCNTIQHRCLNLPDSNLCCVAPDDCDDSSDCTVDLCAANTCVHLQDTTSAACECSSNFGCDDGSDCTVDVCDGGVCANTPDPSLAGCCGSAADCDDGDGATFDACQQGMCWNVAIPCATHADCVSIDACLSGTCDDGICDFAPVSWAGCCQLSADCDDGQPATVDTCAANQCVNTLGAGPGDACTTDGDCAAPNSCASASCASQAGQCTVAAAGGAGCCQTAADCAPPADHCQAATCDAFACGTSPLTGAQPFWADTFAALTDWSVQADATAATWQLGTAQAISAPSSLYYGQLPAMNYDVGQTAGSIDSATITPPSGAASLTLKFWVSGDIEPISSRDLLKAEVVVASVATTVWSKDDAGGLGPAWTEQTVDITAAATGPFQLRFSFDSVDAVNNSGEGVYIDDVRILAPCPQ